MKSSATEAKLQRTLHATPKAGQHKLGRPLAYTGDPDSPHLTPEERRRIRRRISNRESARRIRGKQQGKLEELTSEVETLTAQQKALELEQSKAMSQKKELEAERSHLMQMIADTTHAETILLQQLFHLRQSLEIQEAPISVADVSPEHFAGWPDCKDPCKTISILEDSALPTDPSCEDQRNIAPALMNFILPADPLGQGQFKTTPIIVDLALPKDPSWSLESNFDSGAL